MKIKKLVISNFRCFENIEISFSAEYNLHVLIAPNMVGKSALLNAIKIATSSYLRKINGGNLGININDFRVIGTNPLADIARECKIIATIELTNWSEKEWKTTEIKWQIARNNFLNERTTYTQIDGGDLDKIATRTYDRVAEKKENCIPLILYVGTEYIHLAHAKTETLKLDGSSMQGYLYCLEKNSMEKYVFDWLLQMNEIMQEQEEKSNAQLLFGDLPYTFLDTFETVLKHIFPDEIEAVQWIKNFKPTKKQKKDLKKLDGFEQAMKFILTFRFKNNEVCTYEMLSDGYKYLILLAGELVVRCILLNKHLKFNAIGETNGVVIIDEFGIHLHPELQNAALIRLSQTFPKIQFIISTHSPLLLNGLKKEQIHILNKDSEGTRTIYNPNQDIIGLGADGILREIFGLVSTFDETSLNWANEYKTLFNKKLADSLTQNEIEQFKILLKKLASIKLDPSLEYRNIEEDKLYKRFKERLQLYYSNLPTNKEELTDEDIDKLLNEILNK